MIPFLRTRLSLLMALQMATMGSWASVLGRHLELLGFTRVQIAAVYGTLAIAALASSLLAGQIVDRWMATEWYLALSFIGSGVFLFLAAQVTVEDPSKFSKMWACLLASNIFFTPTFALANSISFHHLKDARREFPIVRVFGTVGWIIAGWVLGAWMKWTGRPIGDCLHLASFFAVISALYCITLPHTPPARNAVEWFAAGKAIKMLRDPSFAVFVAAAFVGSFFGSFVFFRASEFYPVVGISDANIPLVLSVGQLTEILVMLLLPWFYIHLGARRTIALGIFVWALRYALLAMGQPVWLMIAAQGLHGLCFTLTSVTSHIYTNRICAPDVRASAQSLMTVVALGFGMLAGAYAGGFLLRMTATNWPLFWTVAAAGSAVNLIFFLAGFRARDEDQAAGLARSLR